LFVQDELDLAGLIGEISGVEMPALMLTAGLRFDENTVTRWELSPRAALVFKPVPDHSLRMGYAHAFLKPTFFESSIRLRLEDAIDPSLGEFDMTNPDLENQVIDSLEMGYSGSFLDGSLVLRLDFAYNWYRNQIWFEIDPSRMDYIQIGTARIPKLSGPGIGFRNYPNRHEGHDLELQVIALPSERARLFFHAGYRQVFDMKTSDFLKAEPVLRMGAGADYTAEAGLTVSLRAFYKSKHVKPIADPVSFLEPTVPVMIPAQLLLNARLAWKLSAEPLDLQTGVEVFNLPGSRVRQFAGLERHNRADYSGERIDRRFVLFLSGRLW
jgi:outer membrane receptor for ferrienterochelin and colicin